MDEPKNVLLEEVRKYHRESDQQREFVPGVTPVLSSGAVLDEDDRVERIEAAIGPKTKAIMIAHSLGNPFPVAEVAALAESRNLFLVEDNCDAVGSYYRGKMTGTFGDLTTVSFYPAHHLTMGEGGCVLTGNLALARI